MGVEQGERCKPCADARGKVSAGGSTGSSSDQRQPYITQSSPRAGKPMTTAQRRAYFKHDEHRAGRVWSPDHVITMFYFDHRCGGWWQAVCQGFVGQCICLTWRQAWPGIAAVAPPVLSQLTIPRPAPPFCVPQLQLPHLQDAGAALLPPGHGERQREPAAQHRRVKQTL